MYGSTKGGQRFVYKDEKTGKTFKMPIAGKTGTTQNFTDSWTAAYSPYYTTVAWFGFDRRGQSLGQQSTGAGLASYAVANYMVEIHKGKPNKDFLRPETGLRRVKVCKISGDLPTDKCKDGTVDLWFLTGTEPKEKCTLHETTEHIEKLGIDRLREGRDPFGEKSIDIDDGLHIDPNVFKELDDEYDDEDDPYYDDSDVENTGIDDKTEEGDDSNDREASKDSSNEEVDDTGDNSDDDDDGGEVNPWL